MAEDIWETESISSTLEEIGLTAGADATLPDDVRFVRRVRENLEAAANQHGVLSAPTAFVFAPDLSDEVRAKTDLHRRIHTGEINPAGQMWFVGAAVRAGYCMPLEDRSTDQVLELCETLGFGRSPTVYCDTAVTPPLFAWYPSGVSEPDYLIETPIEQATPSLDDLIEIVDRVHRTRLMTAHNQNRDTKLWEDPDKHWAHDRAEKRVQDALMAGIGGAFGRPYFVEQERTGDAGRFDIGFREREAGGTSTLHAILELKVARSFGSGGTPYGPARVEAHVVDGIDQAWAYSDEHGGRAACLVFDLRKADKQAPPEKALVRACALKVFLRFWRCFPTAEDYRTFKLPPLSDSV